MAPIIFETKRILVRQFTPADEEDFVAMNANEEVMRYIRPAKTREDAIAFLHENLDLYKSMPGYGRWAAIDKTRNRFAGSFAVIPLQYTPHIQIGYLLMPPWWGKGLASEMLLGGLDYCRVNLALSYVVAVTRQQNHPSKHILRKAGFSEVGLHYEDGVYDNLFRYNFALHEPEQP
jgi:ribosomal-protein-alanine N-acetyltransferase